MYFYNLTVPPMYCTFKMSCFDIAVASRRRATVMSKQLILSVHWYKKIMGHFFENMQYMLYMLHILHVALYFFHSGL